MLFVNNQGSKVYNSEENQMKEIKEKTADLVLDILKGSVNDYHSGEEIAKQLFVSRATVWKAIRALKERGYEIDAVTNRGYRLLHSLDDPDAGKIAKYMQEYVNTYHLPDAVLFPGYADAVHAYSEVGSTNAVVSTLSGPEKMPVIAVADRQTGGRGRRGRSFHSPSGSGIYMSVLLYPDNTFNPSTGFTCMMAVAACFAIRNVLKLQPEIKWVNDLFLNGKKVAGILTEGNVSVEDNTISSIVIGIGINVYCPKDGFPEEIRKTAGCLLDKESEKKDLRNRLIAGILCEFFHIYRQNDNSFVKDYRDLSMLIHEHVRITDFSDGSYRYAYVEGIDDQCHLCVRYDNGKKENLSSGEVSVVKY